jgi:hypothetical protein
MAHFLACLRRNAFADDAAGPAGPDGPARPAGPVDLQGWMDPKFPAVVRRSIESLAADGGGAVGTPAQPLLVVEVGTWKGLSTIAMADVCRDAGVSADIVAVDTWLGAPEFWTWGLDDPARGGSLRLRGGYPTVFNTFVDNVVARKHTGVIAPLPLSSIAAADVLAYYKLAPHVVYVDAAHEYESVRADVATYWRLLRPGGT